MSSELGATWKELSENMASPAAFRNASKGEIIRRATAIRAAKSSTVADFSPRLFAMRLRIAEITVKNTMTVAAPVTPH